MPPVSRTSAANFATSSAGVVDNFGKFATGVNNTSGIFATGVNDAGGKLPPVSTTMAANLRSVRCQNLKGPYGIIRGLGETDPCRKPEVENLVALFPLIKVE